jgi:hypothetical protein
MEASGSRLGPGWELAGTLVNVEPIGEPTLAA